MTLFSHEVQSKYSEPIWAKIPLPSGDLLLRRELSIAYVAANGEERWRYRHHEIVSEVSMDGAQAKVTDFADNILFLDLQTGKQRLNSAVR